MTLRDELQAIRAQIKMLEEQARDVYARSLAAPKEDKVCSDLFAEELAEVPSGEMPYPITVEAIAWNAQADFQGTTSPRLVAVRPVKEDKTYVGIYVGDLPTGVSASLNRTSGVLHIQRAHYNPAIVVPELGRIVFGYESWWHEIKNLEELRNITQEDIEGTWYVRILQGMTQELTKTLK